eukprot:4679991-Pyramimonas_sp.AAC.1
MSLNVTHCHSLTVTHCHSLSLTVTHCHCHSKHSLKNSLQHSSTGHCFIHSLRHSLGHSFTWFSFFQICRRVCRLADQPGAIWVQGTPLDHAAGWLQMSRPSSRQHMTLNGIPTAFETLGGSPDRSPSPPRAPTATSLTRLTCLALSPLTVSGSWPMSQPSGRRRAKVPIVPIVPIDETIGVLVCVCARSLGALWLLLWISDWPLYCCEWGDGLSDGMVSLFRVTVSTRGRRREADEEEPMSPPALSVGHVSNKFAYSPLTLKMRYPNAGQKYNK